MRAIIKALRNFYGDIGEKPERRKWPEWPQDYRERPHPCFDPLIRLIEQLPGTCCRGPHAGATSPEGNWSVCFSVDIGHPAGGDMVRCLTRALSRISIALPDLGPFAPRTGLRPPALMLGAKRWHPAPNSLALVLVGHFETCGPDFIAHELARLLPNPISDSASWIGVKDSLFPA
jgi:hypothetical protein